MTSLSLLRGEPYANMRAFLTDILVGELFVLSWFGHEFLFGHFLCCIEGSVGFTCSLEVTVYYTKLMKLITMLPLLLYYE
jgi:hypothetical protein